MPPLALYEFSSPKTYSNSVSIPKPRMKSPSTSSSSYRKRSSFYAITMSFIIFVAILYAEDFTCILKQPMFLKSQKQDNLDQPQLMPTQQFPKTQQPKNLDQPQLLPTQPFPKTQQPKNLDQPQLVPTQPFPKTQQSKNLDKPQLMPIQPFPKSQQLEKLDQPQPIPTQPFLKSQQLESSDKPQLMPIEPFLKSQKPETMNQQQVMPSQPFLKSQQQEGFGEPQPISTQDKDTIVPFAVERREECNIFEGRWVYDEATRPQYEESECPYIHAEQTCQAHGRPDKGYLHWRWQPHGCSLPSFNATFMLEKLRGKRMLFVGDSLNRGQFISMVCLLQRAIPEGAKSIETNGALTTFKAKEYKASVGFYWSPLLSESNADDPAKHRVVGRVVRAGSISKHTRHWKGSDIIVFSSYIWWMTGNKIQILRGSFKDDKKNIEEMEAVDAYRMAMKRVVKWVDKDMNPRTTRVFFTSMSPMHERSEEWGGKPGWKCFNETTPITDPTYWGFGSNKAIMRVLGQVFSKAKVPISVLNITQLSEYRRDAHSSIYKNFFRMLTPEQLANPRSYADCVHWCLPGLPDTWNELLYAKLFFP